MSLRNKFLAVPVIALALGAGVFAQTPKPATPAGGSKEKMEQKATETKTTKKHHKKHHKKTQSTEEKKMEKKPGR